MKHNTNLEPKRPRQRPPLYGETMKQTAYRLPDYQVKWVKQHGGSKKIRELIQAAIEYEKAGQ